MSKPLSYKYSGTKGHIIDTIQHLPTDPSTLLHNGWIDISHPAMAATGSFIFKEKSTGLKLRFDKGTLGANGFKGKNHYHIMNPNATGNKNMYLDKAGNVVSKGTKNSHVLPNGG